MHLKTKRNIAILLILSILGAIAAVVVPNVQTWNKVEVLLRGKRPLDAKRMAYRGQSFDVLKVDPVKSELRLYWKDLQGKPYRDFASLQKDLEKEGRKLRFATNAGIFSEDYSPGGLHIENGHTLKSLNLRDGGGTFHMKPNGVFMLGSEGAGVYESQEFLQSGQSPLLATQSGPMLVIDGKVHPDFRPGSESKYIRNGVGVDNQGMIWFAISNDRVNFYDFSMLFAEELHCPDALYLDGSISKFYLPELDRTSTDGDFAGILALVE